MQHVLSDKRKAGSPSPLQISLAMRSLRDEYFSVLEHGKVIFFLINSEAKIEYCSQYIEEILHYAPAEIAGKSIYDFIEPQSTIHLKNLMDESAANLLKPTHIHDLGLFCKSCFKHYFDGVLIPQKKGTEKMYALYLHDVTDRKLESEKLSKLNLELDSFIYKASHDLRAPIKSLSGLINLAEKTVSKENEVYIPHLRSSIDRIDKFITQLTQYTKATNITQGYQIIDFTKLFSGAIENYRFLPNADKIDFQVDIQHNFEAASDDFRIGVILNNLISNAIKYHQLSQEDPFIRIELTGNRKQFAIKVIDNGSGIRAEDKDEIFDMFRRASYESDGSGLGLYIVKKALEKIEATIEVWSEYGSGSIFTISIPNQIDYCKVAE